MKFGFRNPKLQEQLIKLLDATPIKYTVTLGEIEVVGKYEESFDSMVDTVRQMVFPFWGSFKAIDPEKYDDYISYMNAHDVKYEEELQNGTNWILVDTLTNRYEWGVEQFKNP